MKRVVVLCGGSSSEREVSLRSGSAVAEALKTAGYEVVVLDPATASFEEMVDADVVFPVLHGAGGEDGSLQAQLEKRGVRYVGSDADASHLCFDKWTYRHVITDAGLPMAEGALVQTDTFTGHPLARQPYVLKPVGGGSSIDTFIVRDPSEAPENAIHKTFERHPNMLLERLILGTELTVGVLGDEALPVIEIIPPSDGEFDYENKYNGKTQELCPPVHVSATVQEQAQELAKKAHLFTGCRDFSRTDIIVEATTGKLYLLETNTIPGMTPQSLFPKMAQAAGVAMPELCKQLVEMTLKR